MSQEKMELLMNYLKADDARAEKLLDMDAQEAASVLAADGIAVTADELKAFGEEIAAAAQTNGGELDEASLEGVSGGMLGPSVTPLISSAIASFIVRHGW